MLPARCMRHPSQHLGFPGRQQQLRLVDGPESCAGRVEVLYKGHWGTVCDDGWDLVDAAVVCRELDCGAPLLSPGNARYGPGSGPIWLDDVNCTGREFTIKHCHSKPWGKHNCNHHEDASVICTGSWKRLLFQKPIGSSKATELPISITPEPVSPNHSDLQNVIEITTNTQEFPDESNIKSLNQWYTEDPFLKIPSLKIELENETKPINPSGLTKTSDPNASSTKAVTYSEHCESSPDCLIKQEQSKTDQRCCCSPQALRNLVHTMKSLHGELGSASVAIKNQGSQLEAVAHNLAELSASIRLLVGILPSLVQPVSSQSFLSPSGQDQSQLQNQLPLK
ncbi:Soluble scavenger receptor cysteine-rich domain-containing protein SSC5D, partial [Ophiophagus hannah]